MAERAGGRGLLLVLVALLLLAAGFDLTRADSLLRSLGSRDQPAPVERMIRDVHEELPRSRPR